MKNVLKIRELRLENGLTQKDIAKALNKSVVCIGDWERGRTQPGIEDLIALANYFECSIDYLVNREDDFGNVNVSGRSSEDLTENEHRLLEQFRLVPEARQRTVLDMVEGLAESSVAAGGKKRA